MDETKILSEAKGSQRPGENSSGSADGEFSTTARDGVIHRPGREELGHDASQSYRICLDRLLEALASLEPDVRSAVEAQFLGSTAEADNTRQSALPDCSVARLFRRSPGAQAAAPQYNRVWAGHRRGSAERP